MPKVKVTPKRRHDSRHQQYPVNAMGKTHVLFLGNGDKPADTAVLEVTDQELVDILHDPFVHAEHLTDESIPADAPPVDPAPPLPPEAPLPPETPLAGTDFAPEQPKVTLAEDEQPREDPGFRDPPKPKGKHHR